MTTESPTALSSEALQDPRITAFGMLLEAHAEVVAATTHDLAADERLPVPWLGVLLRLGRSPERRLRMTQLAREMSVSTSGLTRLVDRIEAAGLVERQACPEDRRGSWAVLTDEGGAVLARALPGHLASIERRFTSFLEPAERDHLVELLRKVRDGVRAGDAPAPDCPTGG